MQRTTITALEMRKKLGGILDRVYKKGSHITVTRGNTPLVTLIPAKEHQELMTKHNRVQRVEELIDKIEKWQKENKDKLKNLEDSTSTIRNMRESRW